MATKSASRVLKVPRPKVPQELLESLIKGNCVLFAGSGLSASAGLPTWTQLLRELLKLGQNRGFIDPGAAESYEAALDEGDLNSVADGIVYAFGAARMDLQEFLRRRYVNPSSVPPAHVALQRMPFAAVLTTNHDTLLERVLPRYSDSGLYTPQDTESLRDAAAQRRAFLLKLYGQLDRPETLIVAPIEYRELVASNLAFLSLIEGMLVSQTFFFVGLGLDGIQEFLFGNAVSRGSQARRHFALVAVWGSAWKTKAELLERRFNVTIIPYAGSGKHQQFEDFLVELGASFHGPTTVSLAAAAEPAVLPGIRKLVLEDIGSFERLELDFSQERPWKVLLGDNGVGKSTVLKAIAVAVIGADARSYAGRLVRSGKTRGRITVITNHNASGYITEILTKDMLSEAEVISRPTRCLEAEGWLAIGFSPLRSVSWAASTGPQPVVAKGRPIPDDLVPLLSGEVDARMDRLKQWLVNLDASNAPVRSEMRGHKERVTGLVFSVDGRTLYSSSIDETVCWWDLVTGQVIQTERAHEGGVNALSASEDRRVIASGSYDSTVRIWSVIEGRLISRKTPDSSQTQILCVAVSADGAVVASGSEAGTLRILATESQEGSWLLVPLKSGPIWSVVISPHGPTIFAATEKGTILIYSLVTRDKVSELSGTNGTPIWSLALSPDGWTLIAGTSRGTVLIWEVLSGRLLSQLTPFKSGVVSLAISANGQTCTAGSERGEIFAWDLHSGAKLLSLRLSSRAIWAIAVSPDGQTLAAGCDDARIYLMPISLSSMPTQQREVIDELFEMIATLTDRDDIRFLRVNEANRVLVTTAEAQAGIPLEMLSQGLTSLLGWVGYLCQRLKETDPGLIPTPLPRDGYALVLLDEIDAHMHPRWQQVLVTRLKRLFPNVQFIVSTHSPLIAAGLEADEVVRFERNETGQIEITFPELSLKGQGAAGLLTSDMFGLTSQLDVETAEALNRKRQLIGQLLRNDVSESERASAAAELESLDEILQFVDATTFIRDPLYAKFVRLMAIAGEAEMPLVPLTDEQKLRKERIAEEIAESLRFDSSEGPLTPNEIH